MIYPIVINPNRTGGNFLELLELHMKEEDTQKNLMSSFVIIGKTESGKMITSITGDLTNFKIKKNIVTTPRVLSIGGTIDKSIIENIYQSNICNKEMTIEDIMRKTIKDVSMIDDSVNANIFLKTISN